MASQALEGGGGGDYPLDQNGLCLLSLGEFRDNVPPLNESHC